MYYVYVLRSLKNGRLYTGSTDTIERRMSEHNTGQSIYTRSTRPFELIHSEQFGSRGEAVRRERYLKTGRGREELHHMLGR